jgi:predicted ATP-grasp superfamily ATP-dependent carboligase
VTATLGRHEVTDAGAALRNSGPPRRVVITDAEQRSVLAAARGLARAGYEVTVLATAPRQLTSWSRACRHSRLVTDPRVDCGGFRRDLGGLLKQRSYDIVIPGTEQSLVVLAGMSPHDLHGARHGIGNPAAVERILDRRVLGAAADAVGLASPPTVVCETYEDARAAARWFDYRVVVKPVRSVHAAGDGLRWRKSAMADGPRAFRRAIDGVALPVLVQRHTPHRAVLSFSGVAHRGDLYSGCLSRYQRSWPPAGGVAAFAETVLPSSTLVERVTGLVSQIGVNGIFELEMLMLGGGHAPAAVDLNPRVFGTLPLSIAAGANLPATWCQLLLGERPQVAWAAPNVRYRFEEGDFRFLLRQARRRRLRLALGAARPRARTTHALFSIRDPLPFFAWAMTGGRTIRPPRRVSPAGHR